MNKKHICASCGGRSISKRISFEQRWGEQLVVFEDVPAHECPQCGSVWIASKALRSMDKALQNGEKPTHKMTVPVWSLSRLKAA